MKRIVKLPAGDWKTFLGFGGLLLLIIAIGLIGIREIKGLSAVVGHLARTDIPLQNAILEMKSANSQYGMAVRSYMFWRNSRYLESVAEAAKLGMVTQALENFDRQARFYEALAKEEKQGAWIRVARASQKELRSLGEKIISLTDRSLSAPEGAKKGLNEEISRNLMDFESRLFRLDAFLSDPLQKFNLQEIDRQLVVAEGLRRRSIAFLSWSLAVGLLLGAQGAALIYRRNKREKEHRELLWRKVIRVEEEERNNLSLQVHDQMGQDLSALKIYLGLLERDLPRDPKDLAEKIEKTKKILDTLMQKAHNISELLRPPELDDLGLIESIAGLILQYKEMTGLEYSYLRPSADIRLSPEASLVLYRVIQEALTNIAKHSDAKNIEVSLEKVEGEVRLQVCDNGGGFDYEEVRQRPSRRKEDKLRLGLAGLQERLEVLGGTLTIDTRPGQGTRLKVTLPA